VRILMASDFYPPFIGGAERQMQLLGQELALAGHEVDMATVWHAGLDEQQDDRGVQVHRLKGLFTAVPWFSSDPRRRFHPPFPEPGIAWGLRQLILQRRPDVVHASGWIAHSCAAALLGRSTPLVVSVRDPGYICATRALVRDRRICDGPAPRKCLACATQHFGTPKGLAALGGVAAGHVLLKRKLSAAASVSSYVDRTIQCDFLGARERAAGKLGLVIADIAVPSDTTPGDDAQADPILDALPAEPFVLFVGALRPLKGLNLLLDAYAQLHTPPPLVLIGTVWPDTPRELPPGAMMLANVPHRGVMAAWRRCLFGVAPSILPESLAGVVREGMISGKAMIATDVGGTTDMIDNETTGLLVPPDDAGALTTAMRRLIENATLRERLGRAGQASATQFTGQTIAAQFEQLYRRLAGDRRPETGDSWQHGNL
jgi:glycosyltransferase involved in cell wall biosynthesis